MTLNEALLVLESAEPFLTTNEKEAFMVVEEFISKTASREDYDKQYELEVISATYEDEDEEEDPADSWKN